MLRALPFITFGEVSVLGLEVEVYCPGCHRVAKIDATDERLRDGRFAGARFTCTGTRDIGSAFPPRPCQQLGHIHIKPVAKDRIRARANDPLLQHRLPTMRAVLGDRPGAQGLAAMAGDLGATRRASCLPGLSTRYQHHLARRRRHPVH
jgi:hypothetical protein